MQGMIRLGRVLTGVALGSLVASWSFRLGMSLRAEQKVVFELPSLQDALRVCAVVLGGLLMALAVTGSQRRGRRTLGAIVGSLAACGLYGLAMVHEHKPIAFSWWESVAYAGLDWMYLLLPVALGVLMSCLVSQGLW